MINWIERIFEAVLWNSRFVVVIAVIASVAAALAVFFVTTVDVYHSVLHVLHYAESGLSAEERAGIRVDTLTHVVEAVDGYLLGAIMMIFALGLYELFVSDLDAARHHRASSKVLVIETLDDLKNRLAKVILMILVVRLFEHAVKMKVDALLDLVYLAASIALVGLALYLTHASEGHGPAERHADKTDGHRRPGGKNAGGKDAREKDAAYTHAADEDAAH